MKTLNNNIVSNAINEFIKKSNITPMFIIENLDDISTKKLAYKHLRPYSGVYLIVNLKTNKFYIGSAIKGNLYNRFYKHFYSLQGNKVLANNVKKYGLENFGYILVEVVPNHKINDKEYLIHLENYYIQEIKPIFNILPFAYSSSS